MTKSKWSPEFRAKVFQEYLDGKGSAEYFYYTVRAVNAQKPDTADKWIFLQKPR